MMTSPRSVSNNLSRVTILILLIFIVAGTASGGTGKFEPDGSGVGKFSPQSQSFAKGSVTRVRASGSFQAKGWRGILPLKSTRKDVEKVIGQPLTPGGASYETPSERVFIHYSDGPCEKGWPYGWNVARDTVLIITLSPKNFLTLSDLTLDESKYDKQRDTHLSDRIHYNNQREGVDIEVDEFGGKVINVSYLPTTRDRHLQCPDASRRLPPGRSQADSFFKFDAYGDVPFAYEGERLDRFAGEIQRRPDAEGYVIAYAGKSAYVGEARARAECARRYLIKKHHIKADKILAIDGGYRETREVELYVEPQGGPLPLAAPSLRPSKVKITQKKSPRCGTDSTLITPRGSSYETASERVFVHFSDATQACVVPARPNQQSYRSQQRLKDVKIYFTLDLTDPTRERREESVSLVMRESGAAEALLFDRDRSAVVAAYKGLISKAEFRRWTARVGAAIREANSLKEDNTIVRESDLFLLSIKFENGKVEGTGGKVADMTEDVRGLVADLNLVWRRFRETPRAAGYFKTKLIDKQTFASLQQKRDVHFASIEDFSLDLRRVIEEAINHEGFHPLSQARYDELRTQQRLLIFEGSAYVLNLFQSQGNPRQQ
jgi:hypothetical protein